MVTSTQPEMSSGPMALFTLILVNNIKMVSVSMVNLQGLSNRAEQYSRPGAAGLYKLIL